MEQLERRRAIRNMVIFAVLVNGLAWLGPLLGGSPSEPGLGLLVWGTAPIVAALVIKLVLRDRTSLGLRPALRGNGRAYAISLLIYPVSIGIVLALGVGLGASTLAAFSLAELVPVMAPLAVTYFFFALFEEVGWRGYLAPRMASVNDGLLGHAFVGLIWASWHFPYLQELWAHTGEGVWTLLPRFVLGTIISTILYGEIRLRAGTVWPAVLMHWTGNTLANTLLVGGFVVMVPGRAWLGSFGVEGVVMMVLFGAVGLALYRQRRQTERQVSAANTAFQQANAAD